MVCRKRTEPTSPLFVILLSIFCTTPTHPHYDWPKASLIFYYSMLNVLQLLSTLLSIYLSIYLVLKNHSIWCLHPFVLPPVAAIASSLTRSGGPCSVPSIPSMLRYSVGLLSRAEFEHRSPTDLGISVAFVNQSSHFFRVM